MAESDSRISTLTTEQEGQIPQYVETWLQYGLSTQPADRKMAERGARKAYASAGLPEPDTFIWCQSPYAGAVTATILAEMEKFPQKVKDEITATLSRGGVIDIDTPEWRSIKDQVMGDIKGDIQRQLYRGGYGQHDAGWIAFYSFMADVVGVTGLEALDGMKEIAQSSGWWWPFTGLVILTERPENMARDDEGRLHAENGPALRYPDGWSIWAWHGVQVPSDLIMGEWDMPRILTEPNSEIRRCAIERIGWELFIEQAKLPLVSGPVPDPGNPGQTLTLYDIPEKIYDVDVRVLLVTNGTVERDGTRHRFGLTVSSQIDDPVEAAADTYGLTKEMYSRLRRRT